MQIRADDCAPGVDLTGHKDDYAFIARAVLATLSTQLEARALCVRRCSGHWFVWDGIGYNRVDDEGIGAKVRPILETCWYRELSRAKNPNDAPSYHRRSLEPTSHTVRETLSAMLAVPGVCSDEQPDQNQDELVFDNGRVNLRTGELTPHTPEVFSTKRVSVAYPARYTDALAADERGWLAYLASLELEPLTLAYLRRAFGYAITGRGCEKSLFFLHGKKNTSKTTLLRIVMRVLGKTSSGGYAAETDCGDWLENRNALGASHTDSLIGVEGARVVFGDETGENARLNEARIKRAFGGSGSTLRMSAKGEKGRDVPIRFALFFASNHLPCSSDAATQDRLKLITHTRVVEKPDPSFIDRFLTPGMRQAVLCWLVTAASEYIEHGLGEEPQSVKDQRAEFARDNDMLGQFLRDRIGQRVNLWQSDSDMLRCSVISSELARWSKDNGSGFRVAPNRLPRMVAERTGFCLRTTRDKTKAFRELALLNDSDGLPAANVIPLTLVGDE